MNGIFRSMSFFSSLSYINDMRRSRHLTNVGGLSHLILYDKESAIEDVNCDVHMYVCMYTVNFCDKILFNSLTEFSFK